jgi:hypothetical protein
MEKRCRQLYMAAKAVGVWKIIIGVADSRMSKNGDTDTSSNI